MTIRVNPDILYNDHNALSAVIHEITEIVRVRNAMRNSGGYLSGYEILDLANTARPGSSAGGKFHQFAEIVEGQFLAWLPKSFD